jgi:hypothetical protein
MRWCAAGRDVLPGVHRALLGLVCLAGIVSAVPTAQVRDSTLWVTLGDSDQVVDVRAEPDHC